MGLLDKFEMYYTRATRMMMENMDTILEKHSIPTSPEISSQIKLFLEISTPRSIYFGHYIEDDTPFVDILKQ